MKHLVVHYKNKYPGGRVEYSDSQLSVYCASGKLRVRLEKNGAGQWLCVSEQHDALDRHCQSPIPKESRAHKFYSEQGKAPRIGKAEEYDERVSKASQFMKNGRVQSIEELSKQGWKFKDNGEVEHNPALAAERARAEYVQRERARAEAEAQGQQG